MSNLLSPTQDAVIEAVSLCRQISSHQLQRLLFSAPENSAASRGQRTRRALTRLVGEGYLTALPRSWGGGWVYQLAGSTNRNIDLHKLDVAELYVLLNEAEASGLCELNEFVPEDSRGRLKADAFVRLTTPKTERVFFCEIDRASEYKPQLTAKLTAYHNAYARYEEGIFPRVLWIVSFAARDRIQQRVELIERLTRSEPEPALFKVMGLSQAVAHMVR